MFTYIYVCVCEQRDLPSSYCKTKLVVYSKHRLLSNFDLPTTCEAYSQAITLVIVLLEYL